MPSCRKLSITVWMLALCASLPCLAQERTTKQEVVVDEESFTLASLENISLVDRLKIPKAALRDFDFGGQFRMRYHHENNHRPSPTLPNALGLTGTDDNFLLYQVLTTVLLNPHDHNVGT